MPHSSVGRFYEASLYAFVAFLLRRNARAHTHLGLFIQELLPGSLVVFCHLVRGLCRGDDHEDEDHAGPAERARCHG